MIKKRIIKSRKLSEEELAGLSYPYPIVYTKYNMDDIRYIGYVDAVRNRHTGKITINFLGLTTYFNRDEDNFIQILLHEMVHVYLLHNNIYEYEHHGIEYKKKAREIEKLSGIKIPETDKVTDVVSDDIKSKDFDALFINTQIGYSVGVFKSGFFNELFKSDYTFEKIKDRYSYPIMIVKSNDRTLLQYPTQRSKDKISFYKIKKEDAQRIIDTGTILYK